MTPFQSDNKAADDITEEDSISSDDSKSEEIENENDESRANNKASDAEDEESSQDDDEENPKNKNKYRLIYPSKRNTEEEYNVYIDHAQMCYEQFTGSYSKKNREAKEAMQ